MIDLLPFPDSGTGSVSFWKSQLESAQSNIQSIASQRNWDQNLQAYLGEGNRKRFGKNTTLVRKDFSLTEGKKALLFFQTPEVSAVASSPQFADAAPLVAAVVNKYLSPAHTHAQAMVDEVLMDVLCPAGVGVCKIGYEAFADPNRPQIVPNPVMPALPAIDINTGEPITTPTVVREQYYTQRIPPKMFRFPSTFIGSDFDKAGWLGWKFQLPRAVAERTYTLTKEQLDGGQSADLSQDLLSSDVTRSAAQSETNEQVTFYEIWYRAAHVDPEVADPELIRQLVLLDGSDVALVHRDSPYQQIQDNQVVGGMKGFPIHVLTLRYVSDQAIPPSDCSVSREQVDELSQGRTQMIDQRDRAVPMTLIDLTRLPKETQDKILKGEVQEMIPVNGMDGASPPAVALQRGQWPRENFSFNDIVNRDIGEAWALGSNQLGIDTDTRRTATELSLMQAATDTRMDKERVRVLRWFGLLSEKLLSLIQQFATEQDYVQIVGPDGTMQMAPWTNEAIAGDYSIVLAPDSSQRVDAASEKKRAVDVFGLLGNDPLIDQVELRKWLVRKLGMDSKLVKTPQPKAPEKPQVSLSLKGDDLAPTMPQYINVASLLSMLGIGMAPPVPQAAPPPEMATNPGGVPPVTPINKRMDPSQQTGQLPGAGQANDAGMVAGR